jgi:hypothetical protein
MQRMIRHAFHAAVSGSNLPNLGPHPLMVATKKRFCRFFSESLKPYAVDEIVNLSLLLTVSFLQPKQVYKPTPNKS